MLDPHTSAAIAQVVFYAPIVPLVLYIVVRTWKHRPRQAFFSLVIFSLLRLAGGIITILLPSNRDNIGLIITDIVFLGVGVIPLIISTLGMLRIIISSDDRSVQTIKLALKAVRIIMIVQIVLIVSGGSLVGYDNTVTTGRTLAKVAYIMFLVVIAVTACLVLQLHRIKSNLPSSSHKYLFGVTLALPFLVIRTVYGLLQAFTADNLYSEWNAVFGSAVAFALMGLLSEYIVLSMYIWLGFYRIRSCSKESDPKEIPLETRPKNHHTEA